MQRPPLQAAVIVALILACAASARAQSLPGVRVRADDADGWHVRNNAALLAFQPYIFSLGAAYATVDASGSPISINNLPAGTFGLSVESRLAGYELTGQNGTYRDWIGAAIPLSTFGSFGYAYSWGNGVPGGRGSSLGLILRPTAFTSFGATLDTGPTAAPDFGFGVAVRPLAFDPSIGSALTLTADAHLQSGSFTLESAGAHVSLPGAFGIRGWYDFPRKTVGMEATISLGPVQQHASVDSVTNPNVWTVGETAGIPRPGRQSGLAFGKRVLVLRNIDAIVPSGSVPRFSRFFGNLNIISFGDLMDMVERATDDPGITAIAIENLPTFGGDAAEQELADALAAFRKAGKKVYVYADNYTDSVQFEYLASQADWISAAPTGSVNLAGRSERRLYMKDFLDRIGIQFVNLAPWKTKSAYNNFTESKMSDAERAMLKRYVGDLQKQALDAFSEGRGLRLAEPAEKALSDGPYLAAARAKNAGVIDALQYRDDFEKMVSARSNTATLITSYPAASSDAWGPGALTKSVAVVHLTGDIVPGKGSTGTSIGTDTIEMLKQLRERPSVAAILLRVDSPGGVVTVSDEIANEVKKTVAAGKPVVVSMGDYAASGGYYVSAYASRIFAEPGTITGSIGVTGLLPNISGTLSRLGIHPDGVDLSDSSDALDPTIQFRDRDLALAHGMIQSVYERFVSVVADGRKMSEDRVRQLGQGQVWTGKEAVSNGLVDSLGGLRTAESYLRSQLGPNVRFTDYYPGPGSPFGGGLLGGGLFGTGTPGGSGALVQTGAAIEAALGKAAVTQATNALLGPESGSISTIMRKLAPYATQLGDLLSLGTGPLLYYDWTSAPR